MTGCVAARLQVSPQLIVSHHKAIAYPFRQARLQGGVNFKWWW